MVFEFTCKSCGKVHRGMPHFGTDAPASYDNIPREERAKRCTLGTDDCVIDGKWFFVRGNIVIPVHGEQEAFSWGVWVSLSAQSFKQWKESFLLEPRAHIGPFFGWLNSRLPSYPNTLSLKTHVHLKDCGVRPFIELEPTDHPLAVEQRGGISIERVAEIYAKVMHPGD
ncbi:MAG: DUF2199 domain-containing protein [Chloroflexi bacterium]|nr:DUF2199 domain-containing protein [Chloroflexota bacterium]